MLDLAAFSATPLVTEPFPYLLVPGFVEPAARAAIARDYPAVSGPGSFPPAELSFGTAFAAFLAELEGAPLRRAVADKFGMDLDGRPTMLTVRGEARAKDGRIHTDSASKLITILIYMNESWEAPGGRLRLLRSADSLDDPIAEVPPDAGTLLAFKVCAHSWHGHAPFVGPRRVIQLNYVVDQDTVRREQARHGLSARVKKLFRLAS